MKLSRRTNQGGSVLTFVIVGVVLLVGLGGGLYYLSQRSTDQAPAPAAETSEPNQSPEQDNPAPVADEAPTTEPLAEAPAADTATPDTDTTDSAGPTELAPTGPTETLVAMFGLAVLSFMLASYLKSRRAV